MSHCWFCRKLERLLWYLRAMKDLLPSLGAFLWFQFATCFEWQSIAFPTTKFVCSLQFLEQLFASTILCWGVGLGKNSKQKLCKDCGFCTYGLVKALNTNRWIQLPGFRAFLHRNGDLSTLPTGSVRSDFSAIRNNDKGEKSLFAGSFRTYWS